MPRKQTATFYMLPACVFITNRHFKPTPATTAEESSSTRKGKQEASCMPQFTNIRGSVPDLERPNATTNAKERAGDT